jgi:predicted O-methyltransferase YrrM
MRFFDWIFAKTSSPLQYSYLGLMLDTFWDFRPKKILEWGTGYSSKVIQRANETAEIHTIEGNYKWYLRWKIYLRHKGIDLHFVPMDKEEYFNLPMFKNKTFDFIFIDGSHREKCLKTAKRLIKDDGLIMFHDIIREKYRLLFNDFKIVKIGFNTILLKKRRKHD